MIYDQPQEAIKVAFEKSKEGCWAIVMREVILDPKGSFDKFVIVTGQGLLERRACMDCMWAFAFGRIAKARDGGCMVRETLGYVPEWMGATTLIERDPSPKFDPNGPFFPL